MSRSTVLIVNLECPTTDSALMVISSDVQNTRLIQRQICAVLEELVVLIPHHRDGLRNASRGLALKIVVAVLIDVPA